MSLVVPEFAPLMLCKLHFSDMDHTAVHLGDSCLDQIVVDTTNDDPQYQGCNENFSDGFEALDSAYNKAFSRIDSQPDSRADLARRVIVWITQAKRPWTSLELQQALAVTEGDKEIDQENFADIEELMSVCAGLVVFDHVAPLSDWSITPCRNISALFAAISRADVKITKALLTAGADANARQHSETALETACKLESPAIAELLLDHDVEITRKDCCGKTRGAALVRAVERGNEAIVAPLLRSGADVNHREYSMSALEIAMWHGLDFIAQSFREAGVELPPDGWRNDYRPLEPDPANSLGLVIYI